MKTIIRKLLFLVVFSLTSSITVYADHVAIVICKSVDSGFIRVVAADIDIDAGIPSVGQKSRSCAQVLHELGKKGYEITRVVPRQTQIKIPIITWGPFPTNMSELKELEINFEPIEIDTGSELVFILESKHKH